jgi:hypothetical protein
MTIDIHTIKDDKAITTHHVEGWASALRQLSAKQFFNHPPKETTIAKDEVQAIVAPFYKQALTVNTETTCTAVSEKILTDTCLMAVVASESR